MRLWSSLLASVVLNASAQPLLPELLTELPAQLNETSGLLVLDGHVWTVLDSGNPAAVFEVDPATGVVLRTVGLQGAGNVDIEEVTADASWVYIGDFGNNAGARTDLRIFRIPRAALEDGVTTQIAVDTIRFSFADQVDFTPAYDATNFDCEAFVAVDDSLFLFTKRWLDTRTRLYALPAVPGDHVAQVRATFDTDGLVTAASWDGVDRLVLLGHGVPVQPFVWSFSSVQGHDFFGGGGIRREVDLPDHQTEGIAWLTPDEWIISNELAAGHTPSLWSVEVGQTVFSNEPLSVGPRLCPVPVADAVRIAGLHGSAALRIMDRAGREVLHDVVGPDQVIDLHELAPGMYTAVIAEGNTRWRLPVVVAH